MLILGIDDAGRGPVLGPMVLAGCLIDSGIEKELKSLGVKDSKQLTAEKREDIVEHIKKLALKFHISITTPIEIDEKTDKGINLNKLEAIKSAEIINALNAGEEKIKVIIDCPSPNTL
ncbi:MAG: ribonuclease HII, partial [Nanoarchaeota archaeon]